MDSLYIFWIHIRHFNLNICMKNRILQFLMMFVPGRNLNPQERSTFLNNAAPQELLHHYVEAIVNGETVLKKDFFTKDFRYRFANETDRGDMHLFLKYLTLSGKIVHKSKTSIDIMEESEEICFAKVRLNFPTFVREDYITLQRSQNGWKLHKLIITTS